MNFDERREARKNSRTGNRDHGPNYLSIMRLRATLTKARGWIINDDTSGMGPAELALREKLLDQIELDLQECSFTAA